MSQCFNHKLKKCTAHASDCETCCNAASGLTCDDYYVSGVGSTIEIGSRIRQGSGCTGDDATAGIYTDCSPTFCNTVAYGCITVGAGGLVTAISACTGDNACGSGSGTGSSCLQSSTLDTQPTHRWSGRQKTAVSALDTWETLYECPKHFDLTTSMEGVVCYTNNTATNSSHLKQIYIQNCELGGINEKKFSVRLYNPDTGTSTATDCDLVSTTIPAEVSLIDRIKLDDNQRVKVLEHESPLTLSGGDLIQIQAHTSTTGWTISAWIEADVSTTYVSSNQGSDGANAIANMSGLSRKLGTSTANRRLKPGG
jgi:hypothetical protein